MGTELTDRMTPGWRYLRRILPLAAILVGFAFVASCSGDTLYDPASEEPGEEEPPPPPDDPDAVTSTIRVRLESSPRLETTDEIRFSVSAVNNPLGLGIARLGSTALVRSTARSDTVVLSDSETVAAGRDTVTSVFTYELPAVDEVDLPDTLHVAVSGLAFDARDNCGGGVQPDFEDEVGCETLDVAGSEATVAVAEAEPLEIVIVRGRTSLLPVRGGTPADLVVDVERSRAYVSDVTNNRVHTLEVGSGSWSAETFVGSEPWGLAINSAGDSLIIANSGGTSISHVSLSGTPREDLSRRLVTNNTPLFEIERKVDNVTGLVKLDGRFIDFSDRPQFIAQDARGKLLYSTRPTSAASAGTIRMVRREPGWDVAESRILLVDGDIKFDSSVVAIAHVDSITRFSVNQGNDQVEIYDHRPGFPNELIRSGVANVEEAIRVMVEETASDIAWGNGTWELDRLALEDTTFVAASDDREWVAFGANVGPIVMWDASASKIHRRLLVADLVSNASERVTGLGLNEDGSLGAARGQLGSYYWNTSLRLLGSTTARQMGDVGGAGVALHPEHPSFAEVASSSQRTLSFVGQGNHTVRILDTVHFTERGVLEIRDNIVGPLRAGPPLPTDNGGVGANCTGQSCVVAKLYGITDAGGVVVLDIRRRDIGGLQ